MRNGILRVVEIGPSKTLATMFPKSVLRLKEQGDEGIAVATQMKAEQGKVRALLEKANATRGYTLDEIPLAPVTQSGGIMVLSFATDKDTLQQLAEEEEP